MFKVEGDAMDAEAQTERFASANGDSAVVATKSAADCECNVRVRLSYACCSIDSELACSVPPLQRACNWFLEPL